MPQEFKNMNDLLAYLGTLEQRVSTLEQENQNLKSGLQAQANLEGSIIARQVQKSLPQTNLLSKDFLKRAFAVWGHFFIANFLIGIIIGAAYFCIVVVIVGMFIKNIQQ